MTANELHEMGRRLYGEGLIATIYIRAMAKDLHLPEVDVRDWWYGLGNGIPNRAKETLEDFVLQRRRIQ